MVIKSAKEDLDAYYSGNTQYYENEQNLLLNQLEQLNDSDKEKYWKMCIRDSTKDQNHGKELKNKDLKCILQQKLQKEQISS